MNGSPSPGRAAWGIWPCSTPSHGTPRLRGRHRRRQARPCQAARRRLAINASAGDPEAAVKKATDGGAHGVLITAPSLSAFKQGVAMTRKRGTCVLVGLPPGEFPVPLFEVVASCVTIRGSFVGSGPDMAEALAFAAEGKVKADIELRPCRRSTRSSSDFSTATCRPAWCSSSGARRKTSARRPMGSRRRSAGDGSSEPRRERCARPPSTGSAATPTGRSSLPSHTHCARYPSVVRVHRLCTSWTHTRLHNTPTSARMIPRVAIRL